MARENTTSSRRAKASEKRANALQLRKAGYSYPKIGEALGVSQQQAHRYVKQALEDLAQETREGATELRALELARLDDLQASVWSAARKGDYAAVDRALKIADSRAKLLGLYAPIKIDVHLTALIVQAIDAMERIGLDPAEVFNTMIAECAKEEALHGRADTEPAGAGEPIAHPRPATLR